MKLDNAVCATNKAKEGVEVERENLRKELEFERNRTANLEADLERLIKENERFKSAQKEINHEKRKYAAKRKDLSVKMMELEREKNKWELIAKFTARVRKHKFEAAQETYEVIY
jgi:chromosome segregation ATPase